MTVTATNIIPAKQAESSQTAQYTSANCKTVIDRFTATNTTGTNATLAINLIASGGTAGDSNLIMKAHTIQPGETYYCNDVVGQVLESGGFISTIAGTASAITIMASGRVIT